MKITKDNINTLKIGQRVYRAHWGFKMISRSIYLGVHDISPNLNWKKHIFFDNKDSFSFSANLTDIKEIQLPEPLRDETLYTTYEEVCIKSRELALHGIEHYNTHDFKYKPIIVKD